MGYQVPPNQGGILMRLTGKSRSTACGAEARRWGKPDAKTAFGVSSAVV